MTEPIQTSPGRPKKTWLQFLATFMVNELMGYKNKYKLKTWPDPADASFVLRAIYEERIPRNEGKKILEALFRAHGEAEK